MSDDKEPAKCRGCGKILRGTDYMYGGPAFDLETGERAKVNHYGGYVCSYTCDKRSSQELENSMPGACRGGNKRLSQDAERSLKRNWPEQD